MRAPTLRMLAPHLRRLDGPVPHHLPIALALTLAISRLWLVGNGGQEIRLGSVAVGLVGPDGQSHDLSRVRVRGFHDLPFGVERVTLLRDKAFVSVVQFRDLFFRAHAAVHDCAVRLGAEGRAHDFHHFGHVGELAG